MKNIALLFITLTMGIATTQANTVENVMASTAVNGYSNSFIFVENGITFSVYPDGEFDFYIGDQVGLSANVNLGAANISFNSGYNYNSYVQYGDYGAVLQVENVPIYYDNYGRASQIGNINIMYSNGLVYRLGGMYVYYNPRGFHSYHTGFINIYNRDYNYRPYYRYFFRPSFAHCLVYNRPYRRYYRPKRYTYYRPYHHNSRRTYVQVGHPYKYNRAHNKRATIYRNDKRVVARENYTRKNGVVRNSRSSGYKGNQNKRNNGAVQRSNFKSQWNSTGYYSRDNVSRSTTKRQVAMAPQRNANTSYRSVNRSSTTYSKPQGNHGRTAVSYSRTERAVTARPSQGSSKNNKVASRSSGKKTTTRVPSVSSKNHRSASRTTVGRSVRHASSVSSRNDRGNQRTSARRR